MFAGCKKRVSFSVICLFGLLACLGWSAQNEESWKWIQRCLLQTFNYKTDLSLKKWELSVTPQGFFRHRKFFPSGKQEYYSFHFTRLRSIDFNGTLDSGEILFTVKDDIIVQTYNDPQGDIDSMSNVLKFPVLGLAPEQLDSLRIALLVFKH